MVEARRDDDGWIAGTISTRFEVEGPVTTMNRAEATLEVVGQRVAWVGDAAIAADIETGIWVRVSGSRRDDDVIVATRVESLSEHRAVHVRAVVRRIVDDELGIGGSMNVNVSDVPNEARPSVGDSVMISADLDGHLLRARSVGAQEAFPFSRNVSHVSIEGFVQGEATTGRYRIAGVAVELNGPGPNAATGRVRMFGRVADGSVVRAGIVRTIPPRPTVHGIHGSRAHAPRHGQAGGVRPHAQTPKSGMPPHRVSPPRPHRPTRVDRPEHPPRRPPRGERPDRPLRN